MRESTSSNVWLAEYCSDFGEGACNHHAFSSSLSIAQQLVEKLILCSQYEDISFEIGTVDCALTRQLCFDKAVAVFWDCIVCIEDIMFRSTNDDVTINNDPSPILIASHLKSNVTVKNLASPFWLFSRSL